ncbi:JmjC-domain-containing protein [Pluteus cervinus]|uniref:JmjC-domain-containing protein n=1 Tax=Pluteus cervinus TaxID=181527 RepID=A0ACD3AT61_9AGAR|nr:JmjC-domain-containing protein [Pluteus cervinus]
MAAQPDHFYGSSSTQFPPSPHSDESSYLDPSTDPLASRGIPVFKPTLEEFSDFEAYVTKIEPWGSRSGIVKIIPPKEWTVGLPPLKEQLRQVKIKTPIEQHMLGSSGLFRQENMEKRKIMSVCEWVELCSKDEFRAPGVSEVGLHGRGLARPRTKRTRNRTEPTKEAIVKEEPLDDHTPIADGLQQVLSPPASDGTPGEDKPETTAHMGLAAGSKRKRQPQTRAAREASLAQRTIRNNEFLDTFDPHSDWLPPDTEASDYTLEFCQKLERHYWRNCSLGKPAWYGADTQGSLFTDETKAWNVAHLESALTRLLPSTSQGLPGVNTPYLYFGMWRATFAWHVEDMDLFSINYIHFGAPKFWYSVPQGRAQSLEHTMRGYFPKDTSQCPQFLRHKSFLASPTVLAKGSCKPNFLVQHAGEFVITFPRGYHAGFNLGLNCAESVNFALDSWLELGKRAKACECVSDSVRIDVDQLLADRAEEGYTPLKQADSTKPRRKIKTEDGDGEPVVPRKRKSDGVINETGSETRQLKKIRFKPMAKSTPTVAQPSTSQASPSRPTITLKLGPRPPEPEQLPCCLCVSTAREGLLRIHDPPTHRKDITDVLGSPAYWMAHEHCAKVVPETWVDDVNEPTAGVKEKMVFGVDAIVKDRWNLKCSLCTKTRLKGHGAPIQCTKGKCSKAFHVSCARDGSKFGIVFELLREVEKEVVLLDAISSSIHDETKNEGAEHGITLSAPAPQQVPQFSESRVLKVIKKLEVDVNCPQHNSAIAAAKKASKQDKIKRELLALPQMARIKIRVSAGVFEVSLVRVIEDTSSVEVIWDRGFKREFKWGSVVFGSTEGPVQQKPSEPAPETKSTSSSDSCAARSMVPTTFASQYPGYSPYAWNPRMTYETWSYQGQHTQTPFSTTMGYGYGGYYPAPTASSYNPYAHYSHYSGLQWQTPYQGPIPGQTTHLGMPNQAEIPTSALDSQSPSAPQPLPSPPPGSDAPSVTASATALASLDAAQISKLFSDNPELKAIMLSAVEQAKQVTTV